MAKGIAAAVVILRSGYKNEKGSGRVMKPVVLYPRPYSSSRITL